MRHLRLVPRSIVGSFRLLVGLALCLLGLAILMEVLVVQNREPGHDVYDAIVVISLAGAFGLVLALLGVARSFTVPIARLRGDVRSGTATGVPYSVDEGGPSELAEFARALNKATDASLSADAGPARHDVPVILESILDGFVAFDRDFRYTYVNRRAGEMFGRDPATLVGQRYLDAFPDAEGSPFHRAYLEALSQQEPIELEEFYEPWQRWFETRIYPSADGISIFFHETTGGKLAEQELRDSRERFRSFMDASPAVAWIKDAEGSHRYMNRAWHEALGLDEDAALGRTDFDLLPAEFAERTTADDAEILRTGEPIASILDTGVLGDGRRIWQMVKFPVRTASGGVSIGGIALEITKMRLTEEELERAHASEREVRAVTAALFDAAPVGIGLTDRDLRFVTVNAMLARMVGRPAAEHIGLRPRDLVPEIALQVESVLQHVLESGELVEGHEAVGTNMTRPEGVGTYSATYFQLRSDEGEPTGVGVITRDVTDEKRAFDELERSAHRLENLHEIDSAILRAESPFEIASAALDRIRSLIRCSRASVLEFDHGLTAATVLAVSVGHQTDVPSSRLPLPVDIDLDELRSGRVFMIDDLRERPAEHAAFKALRKEGVRAYFLVPMIVEGSMIGSLTIAGDQPGQFDAEDVEIAQEVAGQLAVALRQARLHERERASVRRLESLHAIDAAILSAASFDEIAQATLHDLRETLEVPLGLITRVDAATRRSTTIAADGLVPPSFAVGMTRQIPDSVDLVELVERSRVYMLAEIGDAIPRSAELVELGMQFLMLIPLVAGGLLLGIAMFFAEREDAFGEEPLRAADEVGQHLALALQQTLLRDGQQQALARAEDALARLWSLQAVADVALARLPYDRLLTEMLELICGLLRSDQASVMLLDDAGEALHIAASVGREGAPDETVLIPVGTGVTGRVAVSGEPLVIEDLDVLENVSPDLRATVRSVAAVPLLVGKRLIGGVYVGSKQRRLYQPDEVRLLGIAAERMAAAIDRSSTELELERRVAERTAALEEANAELDAFSFSVSHDLRAPLRAMRGFSDALLEDYGPILGEEGADFAVRVVEAADRMDELIGDLLAFSRLSRQEVRSKRVDLDRIVAEVLAALGSRVTETKGTVEVARPLGFVSAHAATLELVLSNLIDNALKFTAPDVSPSVRVSSEATDARVRVEVADEGIGIAAAHLRKIFDVFERLHGTEAYAGTGVGLASVKKGVERMGGTVGVESELGQGSTFWFELPGA